MFCASCSKEACTTDNSFGKQFIAC